jgi:predicted nucleic acid-binding protein
MGLCVPYIHSDRNCFYSAWLRQKGAEMKVYELDKSTGEVIWKEEKSKVLELEKMLKNSHLEKYVGQINHDGFKKNNERKG